jgi:PAS domain S-box-containing protein
VNLLRWHHPVVRQWAWTMLAVLVLAVLASVFEMLWRTDLAFYDAASAGGPAPDDVVIVAVDDPSIAALGRWPWRRDLHAALLDRLRAMGARAVALDFLFTEPDTNSAAGDVALAAAMRRGPPTVLPLFVEMPGFQHSLEERLPIPILAQAAAGIGHADLELDRDGIARSVFLREGIGAPNRLHFAATLLLAAPGAGPLRLRGSRHPDLAGAPRVWVRDFRILIPFLGPPGHFAQLSYADVLRGGVSAAAIRGKYVLVGATAQGVGDSYPTPWSGEGQTMAGVEVNANVLQALRNDAAIRPLPRWAAALLSALPVSLAGAGLLLLPPRRSWLLSVLLMIGTAAASALALRGGWWFPPSASLAALLALYPLWSWRRLEAMQAFLEEEFERLSRERFPIPATRAAALRPVDFVEQRMDLLRQATQHMRQVRRLFSDLVNGLPDATILADAAGAIVLANPAAAALFGRPGAALENSSVDAQLYERVKDEALRYETLAARAPCTVEAALEQPGRHVLIRAVPFTDSAALRAGTIIAFADITALRAAQRERDDVLRFLSHDMKSPASSLLGLAQLQRDPRRALPPLELSRRIDVLAQRLLTLVDGFVALARAESADPGEFREFDLRDAVQDACDEVWATAQARGSRLDSHQAEDAIMVSGDRQLLARAIVNLLSNALKFSPTGAGVQLRCSRFGREAMIEVTDQGPGIALESRASLFRRFSRGLHRGEADPGGAGLGLAFVRVVMEKHAGRAWVDGGIEHGAVFSLSMPCNMETQGA